MISILYVYLVIYDMYMLYMPSILVYAFLYLWRWIVMNIHELSSHPSLRSPNRSLWAAESPWASNGRMGDIYIQKSQALAELSQVICCIMVRLLYFYGASARNIFIESSPCHALNAFHYHHESWQTSLPGTSMQCNAEQSEFFTSVDCVDSIRLDHMWYWRGLNHCACKVQGESIVFIQVRQSMLRQLAGHDGMVWIFWNERLLRRLSLVPGTQKGDNHKHFGLVWMILMILISILFKYVQTIRNCLS